MKYFILLISAALLSFCADSEKRSIDAEENNTNRILKPELQPIFDSLDVVGSVLIYDLQKDIFYSNDFKWSQKGKLPASTFKIANSIIALETGVAKSDSSLFKWDGEKRFMKQWEQDLILRDAFHFSCVPCYQDIARKIGEERMNSYLTKLNYGDMRVNSRNIDIFWLEGKSRISQFQQIDFLKRFYNSQLPISKRTEEIMKRIFILEENENYKLSAKTGWSDSNGKDNGWFVGYLELGNQVYIFATNLEPNRRFNMGLFPTIRKEVTDLAFDKLGIYNLNNKH